MTSERRLWCEIWKKQQLHEGQNSLATIARALRGGIAVDEFYRTYFRANDSADRSASSRQSGSASYPKSSTACDAKSGTTRYPESGTTGHTKPRAAGHTKSGAAGHTKSSSADHAKSRAACHPRSHRHAADYRIAYGIAQPNDHAIAVLGRAKLL
jgi:hypothetical protein